MPLLLLIWLIGMPVWYVFVNLMVLLTNDPRDSAFIRDTSTEALAWGVILYAILWPISLVYTIPAHAILYRKKKLKNAA